MREVWLTARKAFTFGGTSYQPGQFFTATPLVAVQLVTSRQATYGKPKRAVDAQPEPIPGMAQPLPEAHTRRRMARRPVAGGETVKPAQTDFRVADIRPEHPTVEALPPIPDAPAPNVPWKFEDY